MKATLVIPAPNLPTRRFRLTPRTRRGGDLRGFRVSPATICRMLNGPRFRDLHDVLGARIETDDVKAAAEILQLRARGSGFVLRP